MDFAQKVLNLRTKYGYSQEQLAEQLNVTRQAVSRWEVGATLPETDTIIALSELFHVSSDYLLKDSIQSANTEGLDRMVIKFMSSAQEMNRVSIDLLDIIEDGVIDDYEKLRFREIIDILDSISATIHELKLKMDL